MPVGMPVIRKKQAQAEKAPKKKSPGRMPLCYEPKPREKMEGKLPVPLPWNEIPESPVQHIEHAEPQDFYPERMCRSPIQMPHMTAPIKIKGTELGLSKLSKGAPPEMSPRVGDPPNKNLPKIYLGDESPKPRWLIRPVSPVFEQDTPSQPSEPQVPQLPTLGQLRWEFDAGLPEVHGQDENQLREYAYCYLRNSLSDPIVREQLREMIWNSRFAPNVAHVEDPLPVPPPPPHFKDQKPSDYANLRPPVSASAPDDYTFMYPGYERPSLAARSYKSTRSQHTRRSTLEQLNSFNFGDQSQTPNTAYIPTPYEVSCASSRSNSTASSSGTTLKEYEPEYHRELHDDDQHHHLRPGHLTEHARTESQPFSPGEEPALAKPPKRGKGRPKRKRQTSVHVDAPTLDELAPAHTEQGPPRKKRAATAAGKRGVNTNTRSRDPRRLSSGPFSADEQIPLPKLPEKVGGKTRGNAKVKSKTGVEKRRGGRERMA